jgi:hypothetical protein
VLKLAQKCSKKLYPGYTRFKSGVLQGAQTMEEGISLSITPEGSLCDKLRRALTMLDDLLFLLQ